MKKVLLSVALLCSVAGMHGMSKGTSTVANVGFLRGQARAAMCQGMAKGLNLAALAVAMSSLSAVEIRKQESQAQGLAVLTCRQEAQVQRSLKDMLGHGGARVYRKNEQMRMAGNGHYCH